MKLRRWIRISSAVTHFPSKSRSFDRSPNEHMFMEDVHQGLMPYMRLSGEGSEFSARLVGPSDQAQQASEVCRSLVRDSYVDDDELIASTFRELAGLISWEGKAYFEIVTDAETGMQSLRNFSGRCLARFPFLYLQFVPSMDRKTMRAPAVVVLPQSVVWNVGIPFSLGGAYGYRRTLRKIGRYDTISPKFWRNALMEGNELPRTDVSEYRGNAVAYIRKITRHWGWNMRDFGQELNTEYFTFHRYIKRHRAHAILRDHLKRELMALFGRLGLSVSIEIDGVPSVSDCDTALSLMQSGEIGFAEVSERLSGD